MSTATCLFREYRFIVSTATPLNQPLIISSLLCQHVIEALFLVLLALLY